MNRFLRIVILGLIACFLVSPLSLGWAANNPPLSPQDRIIADCTEAIAANPNDYVSYLKRGRAYQEKRQFDEAIADCNKAIEINPKYAAAYYTRGRISHDRKKWDPAIEDYTQAINFDPSYAPAFSNRAFCYNQKAEYNQAILDATRAIELAPKLVKWAYFHLGDAYTKKHQYDDAIATYRAAINNLSDPNAVEMAKERIRILGGTI